MEDLQVVFDNTPGTDVGRASATTQEIGSDVTNVQILGLISNQFAGTWKCFATFPGSAEAWRLCAPIQS